MATATGSVWLQKQLTLRQRPRGCHIITSEVTSAIRKELSQITIGICHIFIQHTSAVSCLSLFHLRSDKHRRLQPRTEHQNDSELCSPLSY